MRYLALLLCGSVCVAAPFREANGLVEFEAEAAHAVTPAESWRKVPAGKGEAYKVLENGPWNRSLRFDIQFSTPGTYRLWVRARKNPDASRYSGNDMKVFLFAADEEQRLAPNHYPFEVGLKEQKTFRWLDWPKNSPTQTTDLVVKRPGLHHFYIVGGAGEEWGWELDAIRLTKDNAAPPDGGSAPYVESPGA